MNNLNKQWQEATIVGRMRAQQVWCFCGTGDMELPLALYDQDSNTFFYDMTYEIHAVLESCNFKLLGAKAKAITLSKLLERV